MQNSLPPCWGVMDGCQVVAKVFGVDSSCVSPEMSPVIFWSLDMALLNMHLWDFQLKSYLTAHLDSQHLIVKINKRPVIISLRIVFCILIIVLINDETRSLIQTITACVLYITFLQHTIHFV